MRRKIIVSLLHACILFILHVVYFNISLTLPFETEVIGLIDKAQMHFKAEERYQDSSYVFINTAFDNTLLNTETALGDSGTVMAANRKLLGRLFELLANNQNQHRYILCDLVFDHRSQDDAYLQAQLHRVKKMIMPALPEQESVTQAALSYSNTAPAEYIMYEYITYEGKASKIQLYSADHARKALPLVMYEDYSGKNSTISWLGLWQKGQYLPCYIYPQYFFTNQTIENKQLTLNRMVQFLESGNDAFYNHIVKNKIIVIGNFESDMHLTPIGEKVAGSLILFNSFLTIRDTFPSKSWPWFLFIFSWFLLLSYYAVYHHEIFESTSKWHRRLHFLGITGLCILLSFLSEWFFSMHTTILLLILYFGMVLLLKDLPWSGFYQFVAFWTKPVLKRQGFARRVANKKVIHLK